MTNAERKQKLLDMLAQPEEMRKADASVRFKDSASIVKAIQEIERQEALEASTSRPLSTFAQVNRTS